MPQMAPFMWIVLIFFFTGFYLILVIVLYFELGGADFRAVRPASHYFSATI